MKILLVDDSRAMAAVMAARLHALGYEEVIQAEDGSVGVALFKAGGADLILMDLEMPVMNGFEAATEIRRYEATRQWAWTPIIFLTASNTSESLVSAIEAGGDDFLPKGVPEEVLQAKMKAMSRIFQLRCRLADALETLDAQAHELAEWNHQLEQRVAEGVARIERLDRLRRFFSPAVADLLLTGEADDPLRPRRRDIVVMFLDLRGYTEFTEIQGPDEVMRVLGEFHAAMGRLITSYSGTLERFTGDGLMVFFNDPLEIPDPAWRAARMAMDMQAAFAALQTIWRERGYDLSMGIGIASGTATIGGIGFEGRRDYGAIGSVTNLAARLCAEARGGQILVCSVAAREIANHCTLQAAGNRTLKGFPQPVTCYTLPSPP